MEVSVTVAVVPVPTYGPVPLGPVYQYTLDPEPAMPPAAAKKISVLGQIVPRIGVIVGDVDNELTVIVPVVVAGGQPPVVVTV